MDPLSWWLFLLIIFFAGIFLKIYTLAAIAFMLAIVGGLARWWQVRALQGLTYTRRLHFRRGFPGESISFQAEVENRKILPLPWLRLRDMWPNAIAPQDELAFQPTENPDRGMLVNLFSLRWYERARRADHLLLRKRGVYRLGPVFFETGDIFGLFSQEKSEEQLEFITVFPLPVPVARLKLSAEDPFGDRKAPRRLYEDPTQPMGVRQYRPEDDFRHLHWPATARIGELQTRLYQPSAARVMVVCLNVSTFPNYWEGTYPELLEYLVGVCASVVELGLKNGYKVGLVSNGSLAHADQPFRLPPGRSPQQLARLLGALAGVTPLVSRSFERFLISEMPRLPYNATLVVVTGIYTPLLAETLLRIKRHGHRITVLDFALPPPEPIPGVNLIHLPFMRGGTQAGPSQG